MTRRRNSRITSALLLLVLASLLLVAQQTEARTPSSETEEGNSSSKNLRGSRAAAADITAAVGTTTTTTTNLSEVEDYNDERDQARIEQRQRALQERVARRRAARRLHKQQQREQQDGQLQGQPPKPYGSEDNGRIQSFTSFMEKYNERHHRARMYFDTSEEAEHAHTLASSGKVDELQLYLEGADARRNTEEAVEDDRYHLLHSRDNDGWTLLHEAIFQQHSDVVEYLLTLDEVLYASSDSDDDDDDDDDSTAIRRDDDLLNAMSFQGQTPLDLALEIAGDDADNKIVHLMIVNGSTLPPLLLTEDTNREKKAIKFV
eukprot:CAMPEP_0113499348 /NCGR_PEP_ID=MMETSP0014_2-20120614/31698_1 /TAXON_ID=2857 /ORGANISM="Nitzschia sp." /LENGTH=317 /DNA_ID=CAMNT_0000393513 /DNA_START=588 /DNA_END=1538 /DNA_ORIENTATION=- /assembly_acc=CAM_ASM_000159